MYANKKAGVYLILNIKNNKAYIGSTSNILKRRVEHFWLLKNNKHHSLKLQNSWNKHGSSSFSFYVIELCDVEKCVEKEQYYIDKYKPFFNILKTSSRSRVGVKSSEDIKALLKESWRLNKEARTKALSESNRLKKSIPVLRMDSEGDIVEFPSITAAGQALNLNAHQYSSISKVCKQQQGRKKAYGYSWKYKNN